MAKQSNVNGVPANGAVAMYDIKTVLKAAGWTVPRSSDGTTYNSSGDQITGGGSGANGMNNNYAWFVVKEPETNGREWCFQRMTSESTYRIKISPAAGFTGGSPGATQVPSATDEALLIGAGTDASPSGGVCFGTAGTYRLHVIAESTGVGPAGNKAYGWWAFCTTVGSGALLNPLLFQEPLAPGSYVPLVGTRTAPSDGDADPVIYGGGLGVAANYDYDSTSNWSWNTGSPTLSPIWAWYDYGGGGSAYGYVKITPFISISGTFVRNVGTGPYGRDVGLAPIYFIPSAVGARIGLKGISNFIRVAGTARAYPDTVDLATDARVYAGELLFPWEDSTVPLV